MPDLESFAGHVLQSLEDELYEACFAVARSSGKLSEFANKVIGAKGESPSAFGRDQVKTHARVVDALGRRRTPWREVDISGWLDDGFAASDIK